MARPLVTTAAEPAAPTGGCQLGTASDQIRHVVYMPFDNVHFTRAVPNVPSDLEQMPHLLNFFVSTGSLLTQHSVEMKLLHMVTADRRSRRFHQAVEA